MMLVDGAFAEAIDGDEDVGKQIPRDGDFGHFNRGVAVAEYAFGEDRLV
jgi:hypothetical protein